MYKWNVLINKFLPSDAEFKQATKLADMDSQPDARNLMATLARIATIERIKGQINTRRTAITAFDWNISAFDKADFERANEVKLRLKNTINYLLKYRVQSAMFGAFAVALKWDLNGKWSPTISKRFKPVELRKNEDTGINIVDDSNKNIFYFDVYDDTIMDYLGECDESDEVGGALRTIAKKNIMVWDALNEWMNYNKKLKGIIQAIITGAADDDEIVNAKNALANVVSNNFTMTDDSVKFNFEQITQSGSFNSFAQFIQLVNADTSIALLGQANSSELPQNYGSNAALKVLSKVSADIHYADMQDAEELINRLILMDYKKNIGPAKETPWQFKISIPEEYSMLDRSEYVRNLREIGIPAYSSEVYAQLGLTLPENSPELLFVGAL